MDFSNLKLVLKGASNGTPEVAVSYGVFLNTIIDFTIIALAIFLFIKAINSLKRKEAAKPAAPSPEVQVLTEIRDLLKTKP